MLRRLVTHEKLVREAKAAARRSDFDIAMTKLYAINPAAAIYLNAITPHKRKLHVNYNVTSLYGWRTTNFVESEQAKRLRLKPQLMMSLSFSRLIRRL